MSGFYGQPLASIHAAGFTQFARAAGAALRGALGRGAAGTVVDYGCGDATLADALTGTGLRYLGVDLSPDFLAIARKRHPEATFVQGSALDVPAPAGTIGIAAVGEVVNYTTDERAGPESLAAWLRQCRRWLAPGGVLLFDAAGPDRMPMGRTHREFPEHGLAVTTESDGRFLTRIIELDSGAREVHRLHLYEPGLILALLDSSGFRARRLPGYTDECPFPRGWTGFEAR